MGLDDVPQSCIYMLDLLHNEIYLHIPTPTPTLTRMSPLTPRGVVHLELCCTYAIYRAMIAYEAGSGVTLLAEWLHWLVLIDLVHPGTAVDVILWYIPGVT